MSGYGFNVVELSAHHVRPGEKQLCADLICPRSAENLILVGDYRVTRMEAEDLDTT